MTESKFNELYKEHNKAIRKFIKNRMKGRSEQDIEDLEQRAWTKAFKYRASFGEGSEFNTWVGTIALNLIKNGTPLKHRLTKPFSNPDAGEAFVAGLACQQPSVEERIYYKQQLRGVVKFARENFTSKQRVAFDLAVFEGLGFKEIAERVGSSKESAHTHFIQALYKLEKTPLADGMPKKGERLPGMKW